MNKAEKRRKKIADDNRKSKRYERRLRLKLPNPPCGESVEGNEDLDTIVERHERLGDSILVDSNLGGKRHIVVKEKRGGILEYSEL